MKTCNKCRVTKPLLDFYQMAEMRDGYRNDCKACNLAAKAARYRADPTAAKERTRRWQQENPERHRETQRRLKQSPQGKRRDRAGHLRRKYGITIEQYEALLAAQGGVCALCRRPPRPDISLHVDHDHETGRIRALLCFRCNNALGDFDDNRDRLLAAVELLDRTPEVDEMVQCARARVAALAATGPLRVGGR